MSPSSASACPELPFLPFEIIDLIIDEVAFWSLRSSKSSSTSPFRLPPFLAAPRSARTTEFTRSLASCLLVSRAFYFLARRHLFGHLRIVFHPFYPSDSLHIALRDILGANPLLIRDIKSVEIILDSDIPTSSLYKHQVQGKTPYLQHTVLNEVLQLLSPISRPGIWQSLSPTSSQSSSPSSASEFPEQTNISKSSIPSGFQSFTIRSAFGQRFRLSQLHEDIVISLIRLRTRTPALTTFTLESVVSPPHALLVGNPENDLVRHLVIKDVHFSRYAPVAVHPSTLPWSKIGNADGGLMEYEWGKAPPISTAVGSSVAPLASPTIPPLSFSSVSPDVFPEDVMDDCATGPLFPFERLESLEMNSAKLLYEVLDGFRKVASFGFGNTSIQYDRVKALVLHLSVWDPTIPHGLIATWFPNLTTLSLRFTVDSSNGSEFSRLRLSDFACLTTVKVSTVSYEYAGDRLPTDSQQSVAIDCITGVLGTAQTPNEVDSIELEVEWLVSRKQIFLDTVGIPSFVTSLRLAQIWSHLDASLEEGSRFEGLRAVHLTVGLRVDWERYRERYPIQVPIGGPVTDNRSLQCCHILPRMARNNRSQLQLGIEIRGPDSDDY